MNSNAFSLCKRCAKPLAVFTLDPRHFIRFELSIEKAGIGLSHAMSCAPTVSEINRFRLMDA